jgi:hypothetical protein
LKAVYHIWVSSAETKGAFNTGFDTVNLQILKAVHHTWISSAETKGAFNTGFDTVNLHRPTWYRSATLMSIFLMYTGLARSSVSVPTAMSCPHPLNTGAS